MRLCIYPGTFDPITYGHLDVLERATRLFDRVLVSVAHNPDKKPLFSPEQRVELLKPNIGRFPNVAVTTFSTLLVDFAMEQGAVAIIRGLRAMSDFEFEYNMALMNRHLQPRRRNDLRDAQRGLQLYEFPPRQTGQQIRR